MPLARDNATALYRQIADVLRKEIAEGRFDPSGRLPSEADIGARFGVSRVTVRLALEELDRAGLLERRKGKGTFVAGKAVLHELDSLRSFHESLTAQNPGATMRVTELRTMPTPKPFVPLFGPRCTLLERLHLVDGEPIALGRSLLPESMGTIDRAVADHRPTYALLAERQGADITQADIAIGAKPADPPAARLMGVAPEALVLILERQSYFADGVCAERSEFLIRPERYRFTLGRRTLAIKGA